jgi:glycosyltransferase involved in cell wall biosynthesis
VEQDYKITIVVPCYNEGKRLPIGDFYNFLELNEKVDFVFVNDGSTDDTLDVIEEMHKRYPQQIKVLNLLKNCGKGEAVRQGLKLSIEYQPDIVGFWDADLATPLSAILQLRNVYYEQPQIKWIFGARVKLSGRQIERKEIRHYTGRFFATFTSIILKCPVYDTQCGAKLFKVDGLLIQIINNKFISRWIFDVELIARLIKISSDNELPEKVIYEFPLHKWSDISGSKLKAKDFFKATIDLFKIWRYLHCY